MHHRYVRWARRLAVFAGGATLLQAGGCAIDTEALLGQIVTLILNALVSGITV